MNINPEERVARMLRERRPELSPIEKDRLKLRLLARSKQRRTMRPIIVILAALAMTAGTGGAIALTGGSHENAAVAQYGTGPQGPAGSNGLNGANGAPSTTVITINVAPAAPLPGTATPTKASHKLIRVCKRFPYRSAKFHNHVFHPRTCWYRYV